MRILYISVMFDDAWFNSVFDREEKPLHAASKYHTLLCEGLAANGVKVNSYSTLPVTPQNSSRVFLRLKRSTQENWVRQYPVIINRSKIKHLTVMLQNLWKAMWAPRDTVVVYDYLARSASLGAILGARLSGKRKVAIVTDLPRDQKVIGRDSIHSVDEKMMARADAYIFLTRQMNDVVNPDHKPFIVLEGHSDRSMEHAVHAVLTGEAPRKVIYAGSLKTIYGIKTLCEAFAACCKPGEELHIYGDGDYVPQLRKMQQGCPAIVYHGNVSNREVVAQELEATLLVNPRPAQGEYTNYSFPSKTLEYMVSGTPVLSAKLGGIPDEYDDYLYYFDDQSPTGLRDALRALLDKPPQELQERGRSAKEFALREKNNVVQAKKIADFLSGL